MSENMISEIVFKQLKEIPENTRCFDCGKFYNTIVYWIKDIIGELLRKKSMGIFTEE